MDDLARYELHADAGGSPVIQTPGWHRLGLRVAIALVTIAVAVAAYLALIWQPANTPIASDSLFSTTVPGGSPAAIAEAGDSIRVPPLDASDGFVRALVQQLSTNPVVLAWASRTGLIRNLAVVIADIANGDSPARHLRALRPTAAFQAIERDGVLYVDRHGYDRYRRVADAIGSIDSAAAARAYTIVKPRLIDAYHNLGSSNESFDRAFERAIFLLLQTPTIHRQIRVKPQGLGYAFVDGRLESLAPAQKLLLRMGPGNVRVVKTSLRNFAMALEIERSRLPR